MSMDSLTDSNGSIFTPTPQSKDAKKPTPTFIVSTGEPGLTDSTKRFIKSHVMRNSHRERRLQRFTERQKNKPLAPVESSPNASQKKTIGIIKTIPRQVGGLNPFRTLPIPSNNRTHMILHNSKYYFTLSI
jgi:hypothetical protein